MDATWAGVLVSLIGVIGSIATSIAAIRVSYKANNKADNNENTITNFENKVWRMLDKNDFRDDNNVILTDISRIIEYIKDPSNPLASGCLLAYEPVSKIKKYYNVLRDDDLEQIKDICNWIDEKSEMDFKNIINEEQLKSQLIKRLNDMYNIINKGGYKLVV